MLQFEDGYTRDQSGVRVAAHDRGRRVLFRVERQTVMGMIEPLPGQPLEALMKDHMEDVRRACERAYADTLNHDNLTLIRVEERHLGH